jgi:hypothetical protein
MTYFPKIKSKLDSHNFQFPITESGSKYFPEYVKEKLNEYIEFYRTELQSEVDEKLPFDEGKKDVIINKIESLSNAIVETIERYYEGNILAATQRFNDALEQTFFHDLDVLTIIEGNTSFYRARKNDASIFSKEDLFHIKFESRHIVSTNRFSVPGFPALYLGDSTYTCWEEFGKSKLRDLYFSRFENVKQLKVVHIEKYADFVEKLDGEKEHNIPKILSYLVLYPLTIACVIKTQNPNGNFKPEYIIPQLLLQFISRKPEIDGIKFPSTRIDYSKLSGIKGYNYVFPVKSIAKTGYCDILKKTFSCTEPTSLELEEIISNPVGTMHSSGPEMDDRKIELIKGIKSSYSKSSFGKIEFKLMNRSVAPIE